MLLVVWWPAKSMLLVWPPSKATHDQTGHSFHIQENFSFISRSLSLCCYRPSFAELNGRYSVRNEWIGIFSRSFIHWGWRRSTQIGLDWIELNYRLADSSSIGIQYQSVDISMNAWMNEWIGFWLWACAHRSEWWHQLQVLAANSLYRWPSLDWENA